MSQDISTPIGVQEDERELLIDYYVQKVSGRLRQLRSPSENDKKRWIWELFQNAKDSIANSERESVDIVLEVYEDRIIFKHNGQPFSPKALNSLIWQKSGEKRGNAESTGRFGTGFLTTHTLSQNVKLESVLLDKANEKWGVEVTLNREGENDEDLKKGITSTIESIKYSKNPESDWTSFTYYLKNSSNKESAKSGVESLEHNIYFNLAFTPEINGVTIKSESGEIDIKRTDSADLTEKIQVSRFKKSYAGIEEIVSIAKSFEENHSVELSGKFKQDRNIRLSIAIEIDEKLKEIKRVSPVVPHMYCVFPLIGTEEFYFPVVVNSQDFEPVTERDRLLLQGDEIDQEKGVITDAGINKRLIANSVKLFQGFLDYFSANGWKKIHYLAKGAKNIPNQERDFDETWYRDNIQSSLRGLIAYTPVVETEIGLQSIKDKAGAINIIFPKAESIKSRKKIFDFTQDIHPEKLPKAGLIDEWAELIWKDDCSFQTSEELIKQVAEFGNLDKVPIPDDKNKAVWVNLLIEFAEEEDPNLLNKFAIIPNQKNDFKLKSFEEFSVDTGLPDVAKEILLNFGIDWKDILRNNGVTSIDFQLKKGVQEFSIELNKIIKERIKKEDPELLSSILFLAKFIPSTDDETLIELVKRRESVYRFAKDIFGEAVKDKVIQDLPESVWETSDDWLIKYMIKEVAKKEKIDNLKIDSPISSVEWLNEFIGFIKNQVSTDLLNDISYRILPNQNGVFSIKTALSKDDNIPDSFKEEIFEDVGLKLKSDLLHSQITNFNPENTIDISGVATKINERLKDNLLDQELKLKCVIKLTSLLPGTNLPALKSYQSELFSFVQKFFHSTELISVDIDNSNENLWVVANEIVIGRMISELENLKPKASEAENSKDISSIEQLQQLLNFENNEATIEWLSKFHSFLKTSNIGFGITVPNQNFNFCDFESLYKDEEIPNELKTILFLLDKKEDFKNSLSIQELDVQPVHGKSTRDIAIEIDKIIRKDNKTRSDDDYKEAIRLLVIDWFNNPSYPYSVKMEFKSGSNNAISRDYFDYTWQYRETLEINVLWTVDERKDMQSLKKQLPEGAIKELLLNPGVLKENQALRVQNEVLNNKITDLTSIIGNDKVVDLIKSVGTKNIDKLEQALSILNDHPELTSAKISQLLEFEELSKGLDPTLTYDPSDRQVRLNFENGWKGEAIVFKEMKKNGYDVEWPNKSQSATNNIVLDNEGESHFIDDKGNKYDLVAKLPGGKVSYIQVKATITDISRADQIALPISTREWKFVNETSHMESYHLARVFNVNGQPEIYYMKLEKLEEL